MHSNSRLRQLMRRTPFRASRGILSATVLLFLLSAIVQPASLSSSAFAGLIPFACVLALIALGQTLVIQQGGIDLSVPGVVSLSGVIVSYYSSGEPGLGGSTLGLAIFYAVVAALIAGLINGLLVAYARVAPIVATLGMNAVLYGFDVNVSGGTPVQVPDSLSQFVDYKIFGVSSLAYIAVGVTCALTFLVKKTVFGRTFEAVGANARAARATGVVAGRYQMCAYVAASLLYCSGGIFLAGLMHLPSAFPGRWLSAAVDRCGCSWRNLAFGRDRKPCRHSHRGFVFNSAPAVGLDNRCRCRRAISVPGCGDYRRRRRLQFEPRRLAEYVRTFGGPGLAAERVGG